MTPTMFRTLVLLLSILNISVMATAVDGAGIAVGLTPRQSPNANAINAADPVCQNYARVANLSTVALNSTYRGAFLRSSPLGTFAAISILDASKGQFPAMMADAQLNQQCGNLSEIAIVGAAANDSAGFVLEFPILEAPGVPPTHVAMPILAVVFFLLMGFTWLSL